MIVDYSCIMCSSCNRYDAQRKASNILFDRQQQVARDNAGWERISKFLHFYERYKEHINSLMVRGLR